jgi:hypothetical protein
MASRRIGWRMADRRDSFEGFQGPEDTLDKLIEN